LTPNEQYGDPDDGTNGARGLALLLEVSRRLVGSLELDATLQVVVEATVPTFADWAVLDFIEPGAERATRAAVALPPERRHFEPALRSIELTPRSLLWDAYASDAPVLIPRFHDALFETRASTEQAATVVRELGLRSLLVVPLRGRAGPFGLLTFARVGDRRPFGEADRELAEALAVRASLAIDAARAHQAQRIARERAEESARQAEALRRLALELAAAATREDALSAITRHGTAALGAPRAVFALPAQRPGFCQLLASEQLAPAVRREWAIFSLDADLILAAAIREGRAYFHETREAVLAEFPGMRPIVELAGTGASAVVPLRAADRVLGALAFGFDEPRAFSEADRALIEALAGHATQVIERISLYERAQREAAHHAFLARASELLGSSLELEATFRHMAELAVPTFADWAAVDVYEDRRFARRVAVHHSEPEKVEIAHEIMRRYPPTDEESAAFVDRAEPLLLPDITPEMVAAGTRDEVHRGFYARLALRSLLSVPVLVRGRVWGAITFARAETERHYEASDVELALDLARRAGAAVDRALLLVEVRAAEREAASSRRLFENMASASPDILFVLDARTWRAVYVNRFLGHDVAWIRALGGELVPTLVHPDDLEGVLARRARLEALADGERLEETYRMRHADGSYRWLDVRSVVFARDAEGRPREVLGIARDITRERAATEALARSEETHRLATAALAGLIYDVDLVCGRVEQSPGLEDLVGFAPSDETATMGWWESRMHPEDREAAITRWNEVFASGAVLVSSEYRVLHRDGSWRHVWDRACLVRDEGGRVVRAVGCSVDVSERVRAREALEQADRRKSDFLAMLGHELRNPLGAVRSAIHVLQAKGPPDPPLVRARGIIARQVGHMARLLDDLLDLSRIELGKLTLVAEPLDLVALVRQVVADHGAAIAEAGVEVVLSLPEVPWATHGDPTRLAQIAGNLLSNALKFSARGGRVDVTLDATHDEAVLSVRDDGVGIAEEALEHIFEPFVQAERGEPARGDGGLGLGLALVRGLTALHGGTVHAESQGLGRGARLVVRLPRREPAPRAERTSARGSTSRRVLLVEDNADAAEMLALLLELQGHEVVRASDGTEALEQARVASPDVVLCDIGLPGAMSGYDVARALRAAPESRHARLIALTGYGQEQDRRRALEAGFDVHVSKPLDPARIGELIGTSEAR
jgi:PAS domain S-box-containing protein